MLLKSILRFLTGKREINFYFSTINIIDSLYSLVLIITLAPPFKYIIKGRIILKRLICQHFGNVEVFFYGSARSALYALFESLSLEKDSEVIVTGFTCEVVPNAVIQAGLRPVFADIQVDNFCIAPESLQQRISPKTKAIVIQHTYGIPAKIDELLAIAQKYDLYVIEDCAVSLGTSYKGKPTGVFGDAAIFSFELSKTITSCRGGMLLVNNNKLDAKNRHSLYYDKVPEQDWKSSLQLLVQLGLSGILHKPYIYSLGKYVVALLIRMRIFKNSTASIEYQAGRPEGYLRKISDQQALLLIPQFKRLNTILHKSRDCSRYYYQMLRGINGPAIFDYKDQESINFIRYPILVPDRERLMAIFQENGVEPGLWFTAPLSSPEINQGLFHYTTGTCLNSENVARRIFNLPTHMGIKKCDLELIVRLVKSFCSAEV